LEAATKRVEDVAEAAATKLTAAGNHVQAKAQAAAQTLRPILDDFEVSQAQLEAVVEEYKLKENPRQTRRAMTNHGISKRIAEFILHHLLNGNPVPKAPTAAGMLQKRFATKDGLDRKTIYRHYQAAVPILQAAGWPKHLLPISETAAEDDGTGHQLPHTVLPAPAALDDVEEPDAGDTRTPFDHREERESGPRGSDLRRR
jgi:hypothetical protein